MYARVSGDIRRALRRLPPLRALRLPLLRAFFRPLAFLRFLPPRFRPRLFLALRLPLWWWRLRERAAFLAAAERLAFFSARVRAAFLAARLRFEDLRLPALRLPPRRLLLREVLRAFLRLLLRAFFFFATGISSFERVTLGGEGRRIECGWELRGLPGVRRGKFLLRRGACQTMGRRQGLTMPRQFHFEPFPSSKRR